jgi:hypothetical protein
MHKNNNLVTILVTGNRQIFKVAKSLLDEAKIDYIVKGDGLEKLNEINSLEETLEIQVIHEKSSKARTLLADLQELDFDERNK